MCSSPPSYQRPSAASLPPPRPPPPRPSGPPGWDQPQVIRVYTNNIVLVLHPGPVFVFVSIFLILLFAFKVSCSRDTSHCFHLADPGWFTIQSICAILKIEILNQVRTQTCLLRPKQPPSWRWRCRRWRTPPSPHPCQPSCSRSVLSFIYVVVCKCGELSMARHLIIS